MLKIKEMLGRRNPAIDVNWGNKFGNTFLHRACYHGHDSIVSLLLARPDIDVNRKDADGWTPFMSICCVGGPPCARLLLKDSRVLLDEVSAGGHPPLWFAACNSHGDIIRWWVTSGREMDLGEPGNAKTDVIGIARSRGKTEVITLLERFRRILRKPDVRRG